jgi:hypothetical protein
MDDARFSRADCVRARRSERRGEEKRGEERRGEERVSARFGLGVWGGPYVALRDAVPDAPHILPALEPGAVEERVLDAVGVVHGPAFADVREVPATSEGLVD